MSKLRRLTHTKTKTSKPVDFVAGLDVFVCVSEFQTVLLKRTSEHNRVVTWCLAHNVCVNTTCLRTTCT